MWVLSLTYALDLPDLPVFPDLSVGPYGKETTRFGDGKNAPSGDG